MAWRKQSPPARARIDAGPGAGVRGDGASENSEQLLDFSRGLYPILVQADTAAFRQYLSAWEDVIGDTTELTATPADQLRRTMAAVLRRPQQFGLPAWPATGVLDVAPTSAPAPPVTPPPVTPAPRAAPPVAADRPVEPDQPPAPSADTDDAQRDAHGVYQLDMLTGEFVPIAATASEVAEPVPAPYDTAAGTPVAPAPVRRRRRRRPTGLEQLSLWPVAG